MRLIVDGGHSLKGTLNLPADKSITHRALILAALGNGDVEIVAPGAGADNHSTANALRALGVDISDTSAGWMVRGVGIDGLQSPYAPLDCGNSGTTMRLLAGVLVGAGIRATLVGDESLSARPMSRITEPLRALGGVIVGQRADGAEDGPERAPLSIFGGGFRGGTWTSKVASAQVKSALLLAGWCSARDVEIDEPGPSRDHTEVMLRSMGFDIQCQTGADGAGMRRVRAVFAGAESSLLPTKIDVPRDISAAAFWLVAASALPSSEVCLPSVGTNPTRGGILKILSDLGADIRQDDVREVAGERVADLVVTQPAGSLNSNAKMVTWNGDLIPTAIDEIVVAAAAAGLFGRPCRFGDVAELRVKESDRIEQTARLLSGFGIDVSTSSDGFTVNGKGSATACSLDVNADHRVALTGAVLAMCAHGESELSGFDVAAVSYPDFVSHLRQLGGRCRILDNEPPMTIAIDGPAGAGKSTVASAVAGALGFSYVDTGAIYRCVALLALRESVVEGDEDHLETIVGKLSIRFEIVDGVNRVYLDGDDVTDAIREPAVSAASSRISGYGVVRRGLLDLQRDLAGEGGAVLEGRDIGTVVFPEAPLKFFLHADAGERARRRVKDLQALGQDSDLDEVLGGIHRRDELDRGRAIAPLIAADDAVTVDSTKLSARQVIDTIVAAARAELAARADGRQ